MVFGRRPPAPPSPGLVIGESDRVQGTVVARAVTVAGRFDGTLDVAQELAVDATGKVTGRLSATALRIAAGATVRADCRIGAPRATPSGPAPAESREDGAGAPSPSTAAEGGRW